MTEALDLALEALSITSGYRVPWASISASPTASQKTSMNRPPMMRRFFSGSLSPARAARKRSEASTVSISTFMRAKLARTSSASFLRSRPLSTKMARMFTPASCSRTASTVLSTPPETPQTTCLSPTRSRISRMSSLLKSPMSNFLRLAAQERKLRRIVRPSWEWVTSG